MTLKLPPPPHLLGSLVSQLGGDLSECFPIGSSLLTGCQDGAVRLTETGRVQSLKLVQLLVMLVSISVFNPNIKLYYSNFN